jgi:hypothetical protein
MERWEKFVIKSMVVTLILVSIPVVVLLIKRAISN